MKFKIVSAVLGVGILLAVVAAEAPRRPAVLHLDHERVAAAFATGGPLLATNNFKVQAARRTGPGEAEIHDQDTDIFYILEGSALFVSGGQVIEPRTVGPGETRARGITGGDELHVVKGEVLMIPKGVPHWFKEVEGTFLYYVVKVSQ